MSIEFTLRQTMPRVYKRTRPVVTADQISAAICDIKGGKTWRESSQLHGVPMGTIGLHMKNPSLRTGAGRLRTLSDTAEEELASCIRTLAKWGFVAVT